MATFGLVHGAWHGAWCWELVADELRGRGHHVHGMDLPVDDPGATLDDYARVVTEAVANVRGELVLVAHSLAGLVIPIVAGRRPVRRLVFVNALVPAPGVSWSTQDEPVRLSGLGETVHDDGSTSWERAAAVARLYPDAPWGRAARAAARLRPQHWGVLGEVSPVRDWPEVETAVVVSAADAVVDPDWVRVTARRFGVTARELPGDHTPFLSRPQELAELLTS